MKLNTSTTRIALVTAFILSAIAFRPTAAWAQADMKNMPGMAPKATPAPKKSAPAATPKPAAAATTQQEMDAMPGMGPAKPAASKSAGTPPAKNDMAGMPGMPAGDASAPQRMSAPGVFILRPPQKWVPPRGDNRAAELLSRPALEQLMKPLPPPIEDSMLHSFALFDLLEYRVNSSGPDMLAWDFVGWFGGDYNRLWIKTEGRQDLSDGNRGEGDLQLLYGR